MTKKAVRTLAWIFFALFTVAVTWPGYLPFNRIRPLVLGLPFSMVWVAFWVVLAFLVFLVIDHVEGDGPE